MFWKNKFIINIFCLKCNGKTMWRFINISHYRKHVRKNWSGKMTNSFFFLVEYMLAERITYNCCFSADCSFGKDFDSWYMWNQNLIIVVWCCMCKTNGKTESFSTSLSHSERSLVFPPFLSTFWCYVDKNIYCGTSVSLLEGLIGRA